MYNFIIRLHEEENGRHPVITDINEIKISEISIISKSSKYDICMHLGNQKKFNYQIILKKKFLKVAGSLNYPILAFKGKFIDIEIKNFPRFPCFCQNKYEARNILNNCAHNVYNNGFPLWMKYRKIEIIHI